MMFKNVFKCVYVFNSDCGDPNYKMVMFKSVLKCVYVFNSDCGDPNYKMVMFESVLKCVYVFNSDCGDPNYKMVMDITCTELDTKNFDHLANDHITYNCKSLLIRTSTKNDYCPAELCVDGNWTKAHLACGSKCTLGKFKLSRIYVVRMLPLSM